MTGKNEKNKEIATNIILSSIKIVVGIFTGGAVLTGSNDGISELDERKDVVFDSDGNPKPKKK